MHIYIYDNYLNEKKYHSLLSKIETRITDLGLNGKIIRIGIANSIYNTVENEIKKGVKTIIVVGNDNLLNQVINAVIKVGQNIKVTNIPIGFIPIDKKNNELAKFLGIDLNEDACDILSARRVQKLNLGKINNHFFLFNISITTKDTKIDIDKDFSLEINKEGIISVLNYPVAGDSNNKTLKLVIKTGGSLLNKTNQNTSVFSFKNLNITNNKNPVIVDNSITVLTPANISLGSETINLIVGKNRFF